MKYRFAKRAGILPPRDEENLELWNCFSKRALSENQKAVNQMAKKKMKSKAKKKVAPKKGKKKR